MTDSIDEQRAHAIGLGTRYLLGEWATEWLQTPNPGLPGGVSPAQLILARDFQPIADALYRIEQSPTEHAAAERAAINHKLARLGAALGTAWRRP